MIKDTLYSTRKTLQITEETRPRLQYWILNGIISPIDPSKGTGTTRHYSYKNLLEISIARALSLTKIHILIIQSIIRQINYNAPHYFEESAIVDDKAEQDTLVVDICSTDGAMSYLMKSERAKQSLDSILDYGNPVICLNLDVVKAKLIKKIEEKGA